MPQQQKQHICVIGAGPVGLAAVKTVIQSPEYKAGQWVPTVFEMKEKLGGVWVSPSLERNDCVEPSPLYDSLTTNLPHPVMGFTGFLFPPETPLYPDASSVETYLEEYATHHGLHAHIKFNTRVESVTYLNEASKWIVGVKQEDGDEQQLEFDLVLVCNGHHNKPRIPLLEGFSDWESAKKVSHSMSYRNPSSVLRPNEPPNSQTVLVVGGGPSGIDIVTDIVPRCRLVLHSVSKQGGIPDKEIPAGRLEQRPRLRRFLSASTGSVEFSDGTIVSGIDYCILATGYEVSFPFLKVPYIHRGIPSGRALPREVYNTSYGVYPLVRHLFALPPPGYSDVPFPSHTLAFLGLLVRVAPLPLAEAQARYVLAVFAKLGLSELDWEHEADLIKSRRRTLEERFQTEADEKIAQKWCRFEPMEQFDYRDELNTLADKIDRWPGSDTVRVDDWERLIYERKDELRRSWRELERSGEAKEWIKGIGQSQDKQIQIQQWVDLISSGAPIAQSSRSQLTSGAPQGHINHLHAIQTSTPGASASSIPGSYYDSSSLNSRKSTSAVSPTIHHAPPGQQIMSSYATSIAQNPPYNVERSAIHFQSQRDHEIHPQAPLNYPGAPEARPPGVLNAHRRPSSSFSPEMSNHFVAIMSPILKQQEEKMCSQISEISAQVSQIDEKVTKSSPLDEVRIVNEKIFSLLGHIAHKQQVIVDEMQTLKSFVGLDDYSKKPAYGDGNSGSLSNRLDDIIHLVGEWTEKAGDPEANAERRLLDEIREYKQTIATRNPSPVRHEMGTSPMRTRSLSAEEAAIAHNTTTTPRVVRHEMAVSPIRPEPKSDFSLQVSPSQNATNSNSIPQRSSGLLAGESVKDGDLRHASHDTIVNGTSRFDPKLSQTRPTPFRKSLSRTLQTPTRKPTFQPAVFKILEPENGQSPVKRPGFSPANWKGKEKAIGFSPTFNPPSASSPKTSSSLFHNLDEEVDDSLGGPSFARAPRLGQSHSLSSVSTSASGTSLQTPKKALERPPNRVSTPSASSISSFGYPQSVTEPHNHNVPSTIPLTSPRSDEEDAVVDMILNAPSSSQMDPAEQPDVQQEAIESSDDDQDQTLPAETLQTPTHPRTTIGNSSPLFTDASRAMSPMNASTSSQSDPEHEPPQQLTDDDEHVEPNQEKLKSPEPASVKNESVVTPSASTMKKRPASREVSPDIIEIASSSVSPPPISVRRQKAKVSLPAPAESPASVIEISSDDDDDMLPQPTSRKPASPVVKIKAEVPDPKPTVEAPVDDQRTDGPSVSITLQRATPEPAPETAPDPQTPAPQPRGSNPLDDLLRHHLSPITPLPNQSDEEGTDPKKAFNPKKYLASIQDDDDDVIPAKPAKRPIRSSPRISRGNSQDSSNAVKEKGGSKRQKESLGASSKQQTGLLKFPKRKGDNLAATKIKKRKVAKKVLESDDEEDIAPLKKASMRSKQSETVIVSTKASNIAVKQEETSSPTRRPRGRPKKKRPVWPPPLPAVKGAAQPYLVKWEGWRLVHATWEFAGDLGISNPEEYVETLRKELRGQGLDMEKDENEDKVILLQEALDAGWRSNGGYNKRFRAPHYDSQDDLQYDEPS
ncbi:hypothetical protein CVT24_007959 [Panaeolus cyanescens]|uniref:Chromo domain-containing protein n=1 Tax=Panaeolus cyanescens TaxID=181874 RepID=A0A409W514_9AGAR|nr:hypothetical protein CVT24_007959 [Panaeolus cyanescens]